VRTRVATRANLGRVVTLLLLIQCGVAWSRASHRDGLHGYKGEHPYPDAFPPTF